MTLLNTFLILSKTKTFTPSPLIIPAFKSLLRRFSVQRVSSTQILTTFHNLHELDSTQTILKEISPECSVEGLMLSWNSNTLAIWCKELLEKDSDAEKSWRGKRMTEDEMVGWHHWLDGDKSEQALGVGDGQGILACCSPWRSQSWTGLSE